MRELSYQEAVEKADALKALGNTEVWLRRDSDYPWHLATDCEPGGSHRLDISTSVWFYAVDSETGLTFKWSFDIEPYSANGSGSYQIDTEGCRKVLSSLAGEARVKFREYLAECATKVKARGDELMGYAMKQQKDAAILQDLAVWQ